ncbi:toprim domain-containing protein [Shinella kummerowiae]|uniref:toprim domain-containing protein n=1 Tax=Shinella kummerowiae TaxID=417745 RepID=UPI0021B57F02|nr:toprim domain-containing protein [Shinella kummerowiae]MCT7662343.1 toprim domain-containing protein [Shinella kummerowiae]
MNRSDLPEIKQGLKDRILDVCQRLLPDGVRKGRLWVAHNPVTQDYSQSSEFKVALDRDIGAWKDYRTGEKSDVIGLVAYVHGTDVKGALDWARDFLGFARLSAEDRRRMAERTRQAQARAAEDAERHRLKRMERAEGIWEEGLQDGSLSTAEAHGRGYFAARGCALDAIANRDLQTFRFAPAQEFWPRAQWRHENGRRIKVSAGPKYPAVLSAMRLPTGQVSAVHITFLSPLGPQKLPVSADENAKLMFGEAKGAMIRIAHGPEGQPPEMAREAHPLLLCEGVEDGLSLASACPEARVWAAGSLSALASAPVWLSCVSAVLLARDNDWGNATAQKQFDDVLAALLAHGKPVTVIESHVGKDFNDLIQSDEREGE